MRYLRTLTLAAAALSLAASVAGAQGTVTAAYRRLEQSLDPATYRAVNLVLDSARSRGVPVEPLVNRALQATLHRTPGPRVRDAVSSLAGRLAVARTALGAASSDAELSAGANALAVGVPRETLAQIRTLSPGRPVTVPLGVLTELVAREVAVARASQMVVALLRSGATASQLVSLNEDVKHDVDAGIAPEAAFDIRTRGVIGTLEQAVGDAERTLLPATPATPGSSGTRKVPRKP